MQFPKDPPPSSTSPTTQGEPLTHETREILRFELNAALLHFVQAERTVVLEGLGIISPLRRKFSRTHLFGDWGIVREETTQTLEFEKCADSSYIPHARYPRMVDTRELVQAIYSRLPLPLQLRWSERELRRLLVEFIRSIRENTVRDGFCDDLRGLGQLYAIHNRQGTSPIDWFAGADVFLVPRHSRPLSLGAAQRFSRPVLDDAWELWSAACGKPAWSGAVEISDTLKRLGFPESFLKDYTLSRNTIEVAVYISTEGLPQRGGAQPSHLPKGKVAHVVTNGIRSLTLSERTRNKLRHELVVSIPQDALFPPSATIEASGVGPRHKNLTQEAVALPQLERLPLWVEHMLAAGVLLLASDRVNPLRANSALALGRPLASSSELLHANKRLDECRLRSLLLTPCSIFPTQHLAADGPFHYACVLGLCKDEAALLADRGRDHLFALLESRGLHQVTVPARSSILVRSHVAPNRRAVNEPPAGRSQISSNPSTASGAVAGNWSADHPAVIGATLAD